MKMNIEDAQILYSVNSLADLGRGLWGCYPTLVVTFYQKGHFFAILRAATPIPDRMVDKSSHERLQNPHTEKTGELPTSLPVGCTWATEWAARGLPMGILPCKLGCPLLPYMETVGSSVGNQLLPNVKKVGSSVGSGVGCPWAAHGNFAMQIRLPTTSIYGYSRYLSVQLSGQPTTFKYGYSGQFSGQPTELPTKNGSHL